jgi:hypothetical protein
MILAESRATDYSPSIPGITAGAHELDRRFAACRQSLDCVRPQRHDGS